MKSFFMSILFSGMLFFAGAQDPVYPAAPAVASNVTAAEYFIDIDPGFGEATSIPVTPGVNIPSIPGTININGLANGIHRLVIRTKSVTGLWSVVSMKEFLYDFDPVYNSPATLQNIVAAEYFIDTDPGFGLATSIPVSPGLDLNNIPVNINTAGLSNGPHRLYIRTKNANGSWSLSNQREFIVDFNLPYNQPALPQNIFTAEYFIDSDPGFGSGIPITFTPGTDLINVPVSINTAGLATGIHKLFIRSKGLEGHWSVVGIREFLVDSDPPYSPPITIPQITAAEYFINTDPGEGQGTSISITAGQDISNINVSVNTASLVPASTNQFYLRTRSSDGKWSITNIKQFIVDITNDPGYPPAPSVPQNIVAAEYFINTDPGEGNGTAIPVASALDVSNILVSVNTAALLPATTNWLFLRTKSSDGKWSITNVKQFIIEIANDPAYPPAPALPQSIVAAEYFLNTDPGEANATTIPVTAALDINNVLVSINTSSLLPATTNWLFLRTKSNDGKWSITNVKQFIVDIAGDPPYPQAPALPQNITVAEYFLDTDPGNGNGTNIPVTSATNISNVAVTVSTAGLSNGQHNLYIRSRSVSGHWSITNVASFYTDLLSISADSLLFGNVATSTTLSKELIITNNSAVTQTINSVALSAPFTTDFSSAINIAAGAKDTIRVDFTPVTAGNFIQNLQLQTSAGTYNVGLRGQGITQVPSWTISPATGHNYGNVPVATTGNFNFIIQNTGNVPVTLSAVTTTDGAFVPSFTAGTIIPINASVFLPVAFTPSVVNAYTAQLRIESSTPGVSFVTASLTGSGFNPGTPPVLQFVAGTPYNASTGVIPSAGQTGNYTYKILYKSVNNRPPQAGSPRVSIDLNGDQDFTDLNEGIFGMIKETPGTDYVTGIVYAYTYNHLQNTSLAGYRFSATDDNGNAATTINTGYIAGPVITDQQLDLRIFANDITFSKSNPLPGETFTVFARVSNTTPLPASNVPVKFYRDTILIDSDVIPSVNAFSSSTISKTLSFAAEGFYPIKVWIDSSGTLPDINPLNNYAIRPIIVGSPSLPGGITTTTNATVQQCPQLKVNISGTAVYFGTGSTQPVAGAEVTINTGTQIITTTTNSSGYYSYLLTNVACGSNFTYTVSITDFTFTSSLVTNSIPLPCPSPSACVPAPSMGGVFAMTSSSPCANIAGSNGSVTIRLKYRERNLANFWCAWDQIIKDTVRVYKDGILIYTQTSADFSHGPGDEVIIPVTVPLTSTTPVVITAELKYVYVEYLQIPSPTYYGNYIAMSQSGGLTVNPAPNQPDLTLQSFTQTSFTSFAFRNANIKCVAAGAHVVKIFDSIPGGGITLIDTRNFASLGAGSASLISYSDPNFTSGTHIIKVITDSDGSVSETDETNNTMLFTLVVPPSELTVTKVSAFPTALSIGSTVNFTATVKNTGRSTGSFTVRFTVNGAQVGTAKTISGLNENGTAQVVSDAYTITTNSAACGELVEVFADNANVIVEGNESNNTRQIILGGDLSPYQLAQEPGSAANPVVVRVFSTNQFFPAVRNIGERDVEDVTVKFTLNGNWIGADTINYIKAGEVFASHASFSHTFTSIGNYVIVVTSDTSNLICENSEANNQGNFHIRVVDAQPDLEVLSQYISPSSLNPNLAQNISVVGTVKNVGGQISTGSVLRFMIDDIQLGSDIPINGLQPGRDTTVAATAAYSSIIPGVKIMKIVADPANAMAEEREDNNLATRAIIIGDAPDMARSFTGAITFNPAGFVAGDSVTVNFSIKNFGPTDGTAWVRFLIKDTTYGITAIDSIQFSLAAGATTSVSRRMLFTTDEGFVITEIYNSSPLEFDLLNNNDTLRFTTVAKMKQSLVISGDLDMREAAPSQLPGWIGGKILLGDYDLTVNGVILNVDSAHFIVSNGAGKLKLVNTNAENIYPVGSSINSMNFMRLKNDGVTDNFSVRVADYVLLYGTMGDTVLAGNVDRTWFIDEDVPGGSNATAEFWWSAASELPGFDRLLSRTAHYTSAWEYGTVGPASLAANGQYSKTQTGFTSFSPFTVTSNLFPVPVQLLTFGAQNKTNSVQLYWKTEHEVSSKWFEVERSRNAVQYERIGIVNAFNQPGTHQYNMIDQQPLNGIAYYRLKSVDLDGNFRYSQIVVIDRNSTDNNLTIYPNPVKDRTRVLFTPADKQRILRITDVKGTMIKELIVPAGTTDIQVEMQSFAAGTYIVIFEGKGEMITRKLIKQ